MSSSSRLLNSKDLFSQIGFIVDQTPNSKGRSPSHFQQQGSGSSIVQAKFKYGGSSSPERIFRSLEQQSPEKSFSNIVQSANPKFASSVFSPSKQVSVSEYRYRTSLEIQLSEDETYFLHIKSTDNPEHLARTFCKNHGLNQFAMEIVKKKIIQAKQKQQRLIKLRQESPVINKISPQKIKERVFSPEKSNKSMHCNNEIKNNQSVRSISKGRVKEKKKIKSPVPIKGNLTNQGYRKSKQKNKNVIFNRSKSKGKTVFTQADAEQNDRRVQQACQNLYNRGMKKNMELEERRARNIQEKLQKEEQQLTFKPQLNFVSQKIIEFRRETGTNRAMSNIKGPHNKPEQMYEEMRQCTFQPQINKVSKMIVKNRDLYHTGEIQHFNQLYQNDQSCSENSDLSFVSSKHPEPKNKRSRQYLIAKKRQEQEKMFVPKINPKSLEFATIPFFQRLQTIIQSKQQKMKQNQKNLPSFRPTVGRGPYNQESRGKQNVPIWEQLYNKKKTPVAQPVQIQHKNTTKCSKITKITATDQNSNEQDSSQNETIIQQTKASSNLHYQNLIQKRISNAFDVLDSQETGLISPQTIAIEKLTKNCLIFLRPIFQEMDQLNVQLNYNQFKDAVINLLNDSDTYKKGLFLSQNCLDKFNQPTFQPKINKKSRQLTEHRNNGGNNIHKQLYEQGIRELEQKQLMFQRQRAKKQEQQMAECSFKPYLNLATQSYRPDILQRKLRQISDQSQGFQNLSGTMNAFSSREQDDWSANQYSSPN